MSQVISPAELKSISMVSLILGLQVRNNHKNHDFNKLVQLSYRYHGWNAPLWNHSSVV